MSGMSLRDFVCRVLENKRITFGDLRRLERDILPACASTREEVEILLALDRAVERADRGWSNYLVRSVRDFALWGSAPCGHIDADKAQWLMTVLSTSSPKTARAITREIMRQEPAFDDDLQALALSAKTGARKIRVEADTGSLLRPFAPSGIARCSGSEGSSNTEGASP